jgi:ribosomal protein S27AE
VGKSKNRSKSEVEHLRGEIRRLKSELKYCKRCFEQTGGDNCEDYDGVEPIDLEPKPTCPDCGKGILIEHDFVHTKVTKCSLCDYVERKKK